MNESTVYCCSLNVNQVTLLGVTVVTKWIRRYLGGGVHRNERINGVTDKWMTNWSKGKSYSSSGNNLAGR